MKTEGGGELEAGQDEQLAQDAAVLVKLALLQGVDAAAAGVAGSSATGSVRL